MNFYDIVAFYLPPLRTLPPTFLQDVIKYAVFLRLPLYDKVCVLDLVRLEDNLEVSTILLLQGVPQKMVH